MKKFGIFGLVLVVLICADPCVVEASPYKVCDAYNAVVDKIYPQYAVTREYYDQGLNSMGYYGTCSEASEANLMNLMFGTDYTEQDFLDIAMKLGFCTVGTPNAYINGGQTPVQMVNVFQFMGAVTGYPVLAKNLVMQDVPDAEECAKLLDEGVGIVMGVDSNILWGFTPTECAMRGLDYYVSDHWITVKNAVYEKGSSMPYTETVSKNIKKGKTVSGNTLSDEVMSKQALKSFINKSKLIKYKQKIAYSKSVTNKAMDKKLEQMSEIRSDVTNDHLGRGKLIGFDVIDSSGSGVRYVDVNTFNAMIFGPTRTEIPYCACVLVTEA